MSAQTTAGVLDPVCGMTIDPAEAAGSWEYKGQTYYFCHPSCLTRFKASMTRVCVRTIAPLTS